MFWAHDDDESATGETEDTPATIDFPLDNTRH